MDESNVRQIAAEWSQLLSRKGVPHVVFGSVAMLLHECESGREQFKDIDFLVPDDRAQEMRDILAENGFSEAKNGNYEKDDVTIGVSTPKTHPKLPSPNDDSTGTKIGGVWVLALDRLIDAKRLAVESQMNKIVNKGYRRHREKSAVKHLEDLCVLCRNRDRHNATS